ncbi:MAG: hypothetical protein IAE77_23365 [Prosthecobacter sp.]|uniref:GbsR/MarR family transcriptional regulator n=1 Tax=Prosthecobacter sp. TaxID=1965333 RepID=UPI0019D8AC3E|nr:hypothetical protein [Prosthecobacter sp.]MBE2286415.1 hypothetical protein [Prosthecobacter sp.]
MWDRELTRFIEAGGNTTRAFGFGRLIGRLFALLYLSPEPLCLDQIAHKLRISKASASITVRQLAAWQAVHKVEDTEGRRDFYEAELRFGVILKNGLLPRLRKKLRVAGTQIERALGAAPTAQQMELESVAISARHKEISRRLRLARGVHQKVNALFSSTGLENLV